MVTPKNPRANNRNIVPLLQRTSVGVVVVVVVVVVLSDEVRKANPKAIQ